MLYTLEELQICPAPHCRKQPVRPVILPWHDPLLNSLLNMQGLKDLCFVPPKVKQKG